MPDQQPPSRGLRKAPTSGEVVSSRPRARPEPEEVDEGPSEHDLERFAGVTRTCPNCKKEVFDDAELCYHCGEALDDGRNTSGPPRWVLITALLVVLAFLLALLLR
jgi:uncharacterized protein (DUF983 family)